MRISRKNVLLLNRVIERGLTVKGDDKSSNILSAVPEEVLKELTLLSEDCLKKAGLTELSEKLKSFSSVLILVPDFQLIRILFFEIL